MINSHPPKATRSTLQNRRLNRSHDVFNTASDNGLRVVARRSALPPTRRSELAITVVGSLLILLLALLSVQL